MDLEKTTIVLKKINRLHELISNIGEVNATEKDLLKAYVIDLYEAVAMSDIADVKDEDDDEIRKRLKKQKKDEKKIRKQVEKKQKAQLEVEEEEEDDFEEIELDEEITLSEEEIETIEEIEEEVEEVKEEPVVKEASVPAELLELFNIPESAELSDRLANAPISDLTKSMGINEKIFTLNELFGGNQAEMDNMLVALNGLSSFEEASNVLQRSVAVKYNWTEAGKIKKAKNFLRLVKRRYN